MKTMITAMIINIRRVNIFAALNDLTGSGLKILTSGAPLNRAAPHLGQFVRLSGKAILQFLQSNSDPLSNPYGA